MNLSTRRTRAWWAAPVNALISMLLPLPLSPIVKSAVECWTPARRSVAAAPSCAFSKGMCEGHHLQTACFARSNASRRSTR